MKYRIDDLYFAKCRKCIMDIVMNYYEEGKEIVPRPDYIDYYTILLKKNDYHYINIFDKKNNLRFVKVEDNMEETYGCDLILEVESLANYFGMYSDKINKKECKKIEDNIIKIRKLNNRTYGYKNRI